MVLCAVQIIKIQVLELTLRFIPQSEVIAGCVSLGLASYLWQEAVSCSPWTLPTLSKFVLLPLSPRVLNHDANLDWANLFWILTYFYKINLASGVLVNYFKKQTYFCKIIKSSFSPHFFLWHLNEFFLLNKKWLPSNGSTKILSSGRIQGPQTPGATQKYHLAAEKTASNIRATRFLPKTISGNLGTHTGVTRRPAI